MNLRNRACIFCNERSETIYHLFFECKNLKEIREEMTKMIRIIRQDNQTLNWNYIINMKNMLHKVEYATISIYKMVIWNKATSIRWGNEPNDAKTLKNNLKSELKIYIKTQDLKQIFACVLSGALKIDRSKILLDL